MSASVHQGAAHASLAVKKHRRRLARLAAQSWTPSLVAAFALWGIVLFDPHLFLQSHGGGSAAARLPMLAYSAVAGFALFTSPRRDWYPPLLAFFLVGTLMIPFSLNTGATREIILKTLLLYYILGFGSLSLIHTPDKAALLLRMFLLQFPWWWIQSGGGKVPWHPELANEDGFGPLMVIGMGYCYCMGLASRGSARWWGFALAVMCLEGVVASFARGAFASAVLVAFYLWLRLPNKGRNLAAIVLGGGVVMAAANVMFGGAFWAEMKTIFTEGTRGGTGQGRAVLWWGAWRAFLEHPILGVGAGNFGIYANLHLADESTITDVWLPGQLWGLQLHNIYFQILSEFGAVGSIAFLWILWDFWRRNRQLRSRAYRVAWARARRGSLDLRWISIGLEAALVGLLANGFFYNTLFVHWLYSIVVSNAVLHATLSRTIETGNQLARKMRALTRPDVIPQVQQAQT